MDESGHKPIALVTGASSGIGYELARRFAEAGFDLVISSEQGERLRAAAGKLGALPASPQVEVVQADLSTPQGVEKLHQESLQAFQRPIDLLAANAGVGVHGDFATETDLGAELRLINLNVTSQVHLVKLVARDMVEAGSGDILITSSVAGVLPGPYMAVYGASKAFLRSFGQAIRYELKDKGVNVTVLMPGPTDTDFFERADMEDTKVAQGSKQDPAEVANSAFEALLENSDHVVTGMKNKLQVGLAKVMPDPARAKAHAAQTKRQH
jgi:short-subunit dehydrogenase